MPTLLSPGVNTTEIDLTTIVPAVATSTGAIAGIFNWGPVAERTLIDSETALVQTFGKPNNNNAETWFTAANFLGYTNSLYVVRAANTTTGVANAALNAFANSSTLSNTANTPVVLNSTDFASKYGTGFTGSSPFESVVQYIARYPGAAGNSLKVSVCDSPSAYSSNLNMVANSDTTASLVASIGSNAVIVTVSSLTGNIAWTNTYAHALAANLTIGDNLGLGNASIGVQYAQVTAIGTPATVGTNSVFTISTNDVYSLGTTFIANSSASNTVTRHWEFFNFVPSAPTTSDYVAQFGNSAAVDEIHIVVADENGAFTGQPGTVLETWSNLSRASDAKTVGGQMNYYQAVINQSSQYIWAVNDRSGATTNTAVNVTSSTNQSAETISFIGGQDGDTESAAPLSTISAGYNLFTSAEDVDISLVLQGKPIGGSTGSGGMTVNNFQLANWLIDNIGEARKDCVVFITPDDGVTTGHIGNESTAIVNWRNVLHDSSYAVMDSGYKYQYDRYNDINRYLPTNGDVAGLCARTDSQRDAWWSPAGFNRGQIKNVIKMRYNPRQAARDNLYKNGINPVVSFPGEGTVLYGDKTLQTKPSAFDRINVRRLFIVLEKAISTAAKFTLFEFNDEFTRAQFKNLVTPYLRDVQGRRGITDFLVVCDATNNTPQVIDSNQFVGDIYIKPARSINFIQLNFVAVATGVQFSEVVGKF